MGIRPILMFFRSYVIPLRQYLISTLKNSTNKLLNICRIGQVCQSTFLRKQLTLFAVLVIVSFVSRFADANGLVLEPEVRYAVGYDSTVESAGDDLLCAIVKEFVV